MQQRHDLILLSGGLDSSTALALSSSRRHAVTCLSVDYGQRHRRELHAAADLAAHYNLPHHILDFSSWGNELRGSALTDDNVNVPDGHYTAPTMNLTVVPNRNATLLMAAAGFAQAHACTHIVTAVHAGDHALYPDCRPAFVESARRTIELGTDHTVTLDAPFVHLTKTDIADHAHRLNVPLHLTWSCYEGADQHCGQCGTCVERQEAFTDAGVPDPTHYKAVSA